MSLGFDYVYLLNTGFLSVLLESGTGYSSPRTCFLAGYRRGETKTKVWFPNKKKYKYQHPAALVEALARCSV